MKEQESQQTYSLNCDKCGKVYQSSEGFPEVQICLKCQQSQSHEDWAKEQGYVQLAKDQKHSPIFQQGYKKDRELAVIVRELDYEDGWRKVKLEGAK